MIQRVALHCSSQGTDFVDGIRDLLATGLRALDIEVLLRDERDPFPEEADWQVVVVPDEFFSFGAGAHFSYHDLPPRLVLVNTEARGSPYFAIAERYFARARMVWDIDYDSALQIADSGYPADYLCLGFAEGARVGAEITELPDTYWTLSLPPEVRKRSWREARFDERPVDILFAGRLTPRRERFFSTRASFFARHRCFFGFGAAPTRTAAGSQTALGSEVVSGLAQRSKILLNVHEGERSYFEWHRIVLQGIWNRTLVVTEPCGFNPFFEAGEHYVEARPEELVDCLEHFLEDPRGREEASGIVERAYATFVTRCELKNALRGCLARLPEVGPTP